MLQLYTFLETTLVTVALLPPFINFFGDIEEDSSFPNDLATTLLSLGEDPRCKVLAVVSCPYGQQLIME
jgi:hypothetical protein